MSKHICSSCNTEYKYASYLKRHIQNKKGCKTNISIESVPDQIIENNKSQNNLIKSNIFSIFNVHDLFKKFIDITKQNDKETEYFELLNNYMNDNNINQNTIDDNNDNNDNNINQNTIDDNNDNNDNNIKTYECINCKHNFASRQALHRHKKLRRCKINIINKQEIEDDINDNHESITVNDIINSNITISDSNNTINNNINNTTIINGDINNITNNNNITININPFGCESLQHISIKDFSSIFKNFDQLNIILYKLSNLIYIKNDKNMNFTKYNMNKNIVTYLSRDMELKTLSEREFIKEFEKNIRKLCIELFYIHKNNLSVKDLIECMKSLLLYYEMISDTKPKINRIELKEQLKSIMESIFRNEEIKIILKKVQKDILNNPKLKTHCIKENIKRTKEQIKGLDEHDYKPKEDNKDDKNLNRIKEQAFLLNLEDSKKYRK